MNTPTPRTDKAAYSMGRSGEHRDIERWCDLLNESRKLEKELTTITEQRDRLAEALQKVVTSWDEATWLDDNEFESFREALQSLNQPTEP